jgi:hypothetical protein
MLGEIVRTVLTCILLLLPAPAEAQAAPSAPSHLSSAQVAAWREDLRYLRIELDRYHPDLYHAISQADFAAGMRRLDARLPTMARHQAILELARLIARIGDAHTNVAPARDPRIGFHALPIKLYAFADGLWIRAADTAHADLVGSRIVRMGRAAADEALRAVEPLIARDNEMGVKFVAPFLLVMPEVLHGLGLIDGLERVPLVIEREGRQERVTLEPAGPTPLMARDTDRSWEVPEGWVDARGAAATGALWLRRPGDKFWFEYLDRERALYVQFNEVGNKPDTTVAQFADRLFAFARSHPVDRLVLDLRLNGGGNGELNRPLVLGLIRAESLDVRGRLFVLIGRRTFSAAQFLATQLEDWTEAVFVGEPTASRGNGYGDSHRIVLPQSGITVRVSTLYW